MNPYLLEKLYQDMGCPKWFWPAVMFLLFLLILAGSSVGGEA